MPNFRFITRSRMRMNDVLSLRPSPEGDVSPEEKFSSLPFVIVCSRDQSRSGGRGVGSA